jgi:Zn-dependent protease with chaperone function
VDPTQFPSDARLRVWLMVLVLGMVGLFFVYASALPNLTETDERCMAQAWQAVPAAADNSHEAARWVHEWRACQAPAVRANALNLVAGLDFVMIAVGVYAAQVVWRLRRRGLRPLTGPDGDRLNAIVAEYGRAAGLRRAPLVYYDVRPGARPTAFGKASRPILAVGQGTLNDLVHNRRRFDAIIHHELFHFIGNDVSVYYRALAVFRSLCVQVAVFGLIFAVGIVVVLGELEQGIVFAVQCTAILALGLVALRDYLRRREFRADMWAVDRTADLEAVEHTLGADPAGRNSSALRVFRTHPPPGERIVALHNRGRALRFTAGAALLTSIGVGLLVPTLALYLPTSGSVWLTGHADVVGGAIGGAFLGRVLAIGVWRNVHIALINNRRAPNGIGTGLLAAAGLVAGGLLPLQSVFAQTGPWFPLQVVPLAAAFVGVPLFCLWISACARLRLGIHAPLLDGRAYKGGLRLATLLGAVVVATLTFTTGPYRAANAYSHPGPTNLPRPADALQVSADRIAERFLSHLLHDWQTYAVLAIALGWLFVARFSAWQQPPPRRGAADRSEDTKTTSPVNPTSPAPCMSPDAPVERADATTAAAVTALVENAAVIRSTTPVSGGRLWTAWMLSGLTLSVLALVALSTDDLLYLTVTGAAALVLSWLAYLDRPASRVLIVGTYAMCLLLGVVATVSAHRWQDLSYIVVGTVGTIGYTHIRMPIPGERHSMTLLVGALALYHNLWILLSWLLIGPIVGLALRLLLRTPKDEPEPPLWLGFTIGGIVCLAAEVALH